VVRLTPDVSQPNSHAMILRPRVVGLASSVEYRRFKLPMPIDPAGALLAATLGCELKPGYGLCAQALRFACSCAPGRYVGIAFWNCWMNVTGRMPWTPGAASRGVLPVGFVGPAATIALGLPAWTAFAAAANSCA